MKSSLKTFLAGKNPYDYWINEEKVFIPSLKDSLPIVVLTLNYDDFKDNCFLIDSARWMIDVLDDGTAITYCSERD